MQIIHIFPQIQHLPPIYFLTSCTRHTQESVYRPNGLIDCSQLLFVLEGEGFLRCEGRDYPLKKGSAFYLDSRVPHKYTNIQNLTTAWITFGGNGYDEIRNYIGNRTFLYTEETSVMRYVTQMIKIEREYFDKKREGILSSLAYSLLLSFFDELLYPDFSGMDYIIRFMEENFHRKITIHQLAEINHSSKSTFCKEFKDTFGCTAFEKLTNIRMLNAKYLLQLYPSEKINVIALKCGFEDAGYFCKVYKSKYGISPKDERKKLCNFQVPLISGSFPSI